MSENPFPVVNKPYESPNGFTTWRPQFSGLSVQHIAGDVVVTVNHQGADVMFALSLEQRDRLVALLMKSPVDRAGAATKNVAEQGAIQ